MLGRYYLIEASSYVLAKAKSFVVQVLTPPLNVGLWLLSPVITMLGERYATDEQKRLKNKKHEYIFSTMYVKATAETNIYGVKLAPPLLAALDSSKPSNLYVITGDKSNVLEVANYGEKNGAKKIDDDSRFIFKFLETVVGRKTLLNTAGPSSIPERMRLKKHLIGLDEVAAITRRRVRQLFAQWQAKHSFQNQMIYLSANLVGECVLGVPEFPMALIPPLRKLGEQVSDFPDKPKDLAAAGAQLKRINEIIFTREEQAVLAADKFIAEDYRLHANPKADIKEELIKRRGASFFIVESNLSATLLGGLALLNRYLEFKKKVIAEMAAFKAHRGLAEDALLSLEDLRALPFLDCVYKETLRYMSSIPTDVRKTSVDFEMQLKDVKGVKSTHHIPAHSLLFAPLRSKNFDKRIWGESALEFNPYRWYTDLTMRSKESWWAFAKRLKEKKDQVALYEEYFTPFSVGLRSCPAQTGFVEVAFKTMIVESLQHRVVLDKPLERVSVITNQTFLKQEYFADLQAEDLMQPEKRQGRSYSEA